MIFLIKILQFKLKLIFRFLPANMALNIMYGLAWFIELISKLTPLKKMVAKNVKTVLPHSEAQKVAKQLIKNTSQCIVELLCMPYLKKQHIEKIIRVEGLEHFRTAMSQGRGVIMLTMHTGNYEVNSLGLVNLGYSISAIARVTNDPIIKLLNQSRKSAGLNLINVLEENMYKEALNLLHQNQGVIVLADTGALESRHEYYEFLGNKVPIATGWVTLAMRAGCPVLAGVAEKGDKTNTLHVFEPVTITRKNKEEVINKIKTFFEDFIKAHPEQWAIFLNTYETQRMVVGK